MHVKKKRINILLILIFIILILPSVTPVVIGNNIGNNREDELLANLAFVNYGNINGSRKIEQYKESFLSNGNSKDIRIIEDSGVNLFSFFNQSYDLMDSAWPMKCHDTHHTSRSPYSTSDVTGLEKWRYPFTVWIEDTPVIDCDGTIYVGGGYNGIPWFLYAIYPNGTLKWKYETGGLILGSSPAIDEDGTIYVGSWDDYFYAINPNGTRKWRFCVYDNIASSPIIAEDGTIYFGTMGSDIIALNPNGTQEWKYHTGYSITSDPAIGDDGTIYIGSGDTYFYAINPNGTLKWRFKTGHYVKGPPSIAPDGTIYIGSWDEYLYAFYPNGTMKWKCKIGYGSETNPSIMQDGTIIVGGSKLWAIYPNGTKKWTFDLGSERHIHQSSPTISADGTIYVGTNIGEDDGGEIIAVNPDGTEKWRKNIASNWVESSPSIAKDGTVYIGSSCNMGYGYLHAFGPVESNDPPNDPVITGTPNGSIDEVYTYTFVATDPDNNPLSYLIDWGDGSSTGWTREYASGERVTKDHSWSEQGRYTIRVKAKDVLGEESDWSTLSVTMPKSKSLRSIGFFWDWLIEKFLPKNILCDFFLTVQ